MYDIQRDRALQAPVIVKRKRKEEGNAHGVGKKIRKQRNEMWMLAPLAALPEGKAIGVIERNKLWEEKIWKGR